MRNVLKLQFSTLLVLIFFSSACDRKRTEEKSNKSQDPANTTFSIPEIPATLNTPELRADFLMNHYWDRYNFSDTTLLHKPELSEQAFADFINILANIPIETAKKGVNKLMEASFKNKESYSLFTDLAEKYLYDPNAPSRNEDVFELFLESILSNPHLDEIHKLRAKMQLVLIRKNKPGSIATDFLYTLSNGTSMHMKSIRSELLLLYFQNPECHDCKRIRENMLSSTIFMKAVSERRLKVLAVYPDEELNIYHQYKDKYPSEWIYSYDKGSIVKNKELYDLKAIPTLYLLDKNKVVLLKDVSFEALENYLAK
jgi:thiol-disulfide isomerase/thioredoxin